jgi:hypothetical protein
MIRRTLVIAFLLPACTAAHPIAVSPTNNREVEVQELFTHDGCTVYRFRDWTYHYYVRCDGRKAQALSLQPCGKNCRREEIIMTNP